MEIVKYHSEDTEKATIKKRSRGMHVIRVVLYMLRRRRRKPFKSGFWRRLMEPEPRTNKASADIITILPPPKKEAATAAENGHGGDDVGKQLSETVEAFTATSSSSSGISGYGSAMSLRDMDCYYDDDDDDDGSDDDDNGCYGNEGGDDMIDVKAEEFIAKFYAQMRMQNQAYTERCNARRA